MHQYVVNEEGELVDIKVISSVRSSLLEGLEEPTYKTQESSESSTEDILLSTIQERVLRTGPSIPVPSIISTPPPPAKKVMDSSRFGWSTPKKTPIITPIRPTLKKKRENQVVISGGVIKPTVIPTPPPLAINMMSNISPYRAQKERTLSGGTPLFAYLQ